MSNQTSKRYWRSLDDLGSTSRFERITHREFPAAEADEIAVDGMGRRTFVGLMGASAALAGATLPGCVRKPAQYILPYAERPEDVIPGNPRYFASVLQVGGNVQGVLVESQDGRPTKIEGNPTHPASLGRTTAMVQASILGLYDPDRSRGAVVDGVPTSPSEALAGLAHIDSRTAVLAPAVPSPTLTALLERAAQAGATVYVDGADARSNEAAGLAMVGAAGVAPHYDTAAADVLVALDSDFLASGPNCVANAAGFAAGRGPNRTDGMNRLYAIEPAFSPTGATADNRYQIAGSQIGQFAKALAGHVLRGGAAVAGAESLVGDLSGTSVEPRFDTWVSAVGADLLANRGKSLVVAGERQPSWVHALVALINEALGNVGATVKYAPSAMPSGGSLEELTYAIDDGRFSTLIVLGGNPVYTGTADVDFATRMGAVERTIHVGFQYDETGRAADVHIPEAHALEAWGDLVAADGTAAIAQPLIEPLYPAYSAIEVLAALLGESHPSGRELVRGTWRASGETIDFEADWRSWLHDGTVSRTSAAPPVSWSWTGVQESLGMEAPSLPSGDFFEAVFALDNKVYDGRYANNPWLQELPDPISKITWDNAALLNPVTARSLGIEFGATDGDENIPSTLHGGLSVDMVTVTIGERSMDLPAVVVPGVAENVVVLPLGYGREFGTVARTSGFAVREVRGSNAPWIVMDVRVAKASGSYRIATTQDHGSMEGRPLFREATLEQYREDPEFVAAEELMPAGKLYSLWDVDHLPADEHGSAEHGSAEGEHGAEEGGEHGAAEGEHGGEGHAVAAPAGTREPGQQYWETDPHQWGMSIDLSTCIGCNACTAACNAENNITVVGKNRVLEGREMHWIRLDRYFAGDPGNPEAKMQPVACMHCENAPCEQVCPVAATTHGPSGTNDMAYNRCIGTRYCANNCPYKVRRFNFFNFSRENDERNPLWRLQKNPDVTVRFRGVMEKCTYCVQRINAARIDAKLHTPDGTIADGNIVTACQQACPTGAIVFGNIADPHSRVSELRARDREYALLSWINSHPRTTYLAKISNPNPELV